LRGAARCKHGKCGTDGGGAQRPGVLAVRQCLLM
jgi:hypothetical protein